MHALAPLLLVLILLRYKKLQSDNLYRANVFFLAGFYYFFWLQYNLYWFRIFPTNGVLQYFPSALFTLLVVGIALSRWNQNSHPFKTLLFGALFVVSLIASYGFDTPIKEKLAELGRFYKGDEFYPVAITQPNSTKNINFPNIALTISVPASWEQHQLDSGHNYFTVATNGAKSLELRPNCLGQLSIDIPTYIFKTEREFEQEFAGAKASHQCFINNEGKHCIVKIGVGNADKITGKWRWFFVPQTGGISINIDTLFYAAEPDLQNQVMRALQATQTTADTPPWCTTPADWI